VALTATTNDLPGTASKDPMLLCPCVRSRYVATRERAAAAGLILTLIETRRDEERERHYVETGVSQTMHSLHLPQPPNGLALAFDIAPTVYLPTKGWSPAGALWAQLGALVKAAGLEWGGDWNGWKDLDHFQLKQCACAAPQVPA